MFQTKLIFILKFFKLDDSKGAGVTNFEEFSSELNEIIFQEPRTYGIFIDKVMALHRGMDLNGNFEAVPDLKVSQRARVSGARG